MNAPFQILCGLSLLICTGCLGPKTSSGQSVTPPPEPPDRLEQLVAPIALYPDPLVALILPASTESAEIVLAARYLESGGNPNDVENQAWDDSVKSLAHYPELIAWMNENLAWTNQLGTAYDSQPDEVMAAIQRARARALANGTLVNTAQQQVVIEDGNILILPAQSDVIYLPRYNPEIIYVERPPYTYPGEFVTFSAGFGVGWWLGYGCDWRHRLIWFDEHRREHWNEHRDWRRHKFPSRSGQPPPPGWRQWKPKSHRPDGAPPVNRTRPPRDDSVRPAPPRGAPPFNPNRLHPPTRRERDDTNRTSPRRPDTPPPTSERRTPPPQTDRRSRPGENQPPPAATPPRQDRSAPPPATGREQPTHREPRGSNRPVHNEPPRRSAEPPRPAPPARQPSPPPPREVRPPPQVTPAPRPAPSPRVEHSEDDKDKGKSKDR